MVDQITPEQFRAADGVEDWQVLDTGEVGTTFRTGSFARGVDLVVRIGALADTANHHPDVTLTYPTVEVRMLTHEVGGLTARDVALAREISEAAAELGVEPG
ncbi:4a-hydroxytetrahydrobiopterin dehydratase [Nocardioides sp. TF02-7]|uniref:4a-hydroxytetrahydrobiopterin dehydratase n=1 Tax=Nocardioides sp. TF02-7 TaxID=2917724 RepID=UPI001F050D4D|nr:4a-hydroxytetrahydrobiopterin dehydratase [Nocardioides sp. TF02-7]UMG94257.1 4a-hydroxytetrahydrobiopterin dehydratase [Nocardioides sp. TF02-7]